MKKIAAQRNALGSSSKAAVELEESGEMPVNHQ